MTFHRGGTPSPQAKPIPERIKEAREARGYTLESFAEALGLSRQAIAQFETGQASPSGDTMAKIITLTSQPPLFFVNSPPRTGGVGVPFWRSLKRMEQCHRRRIGRRLAWAADIVCYAGNYIQFPNVNIPRVAFDPITGDDDHIEAAAERVRDHWGLGRGPIEDIVSIFEENGVIVICEPVECSDMDAVSCWVAGRPYILFSEEVESGPRSRFNLAHELGHLVLHAGVEVSSSNLNQVERQAHRFASAFLMPRESFPQEVLSTSLSYFEQLKRRWKVAISAMAYRCKDLGNITESQFSYIMKQMNARKIRKSEPLDNVIRVSRPTVLGDSIKLLIDHGVQTRDQIEQRLCLNLNDVERMCGLAAGTLDKRVVPFRLEPRFTKSDKKA